MKTMVYPNCWSLPYYPVLPIFTQLWHWVFFHASVITPHPRPRGSQFCTPTHTVPWTHNQKECITAACPDLHQHFDQVHLVKQQANNDVASIVPQFLHHQLRPRRGAWVNEQVKGEVVHSQRWQRCSSTRNSCTSALSEWGSLQHRRGRAGDVHTFKTPILRRPQPTNLFSYIWETTVLQYKIVLQNLDSLACR